MLRGFGMSPAASRSFVMGVALSAVMVAAPAFAQDAAPAAPVLALDGDAATITVLIKPDKTAEFEAVLAKVKEALGKSEKAERKQQAVRAKLHASPILRRRRRIEAALLRQLAI